MKIILGMEKADSGTVYFDGKSIDQLNQKSLRQRIGSVFQFSKLFPGTIFSNVSFGSSHEVSEEDVRAALRAIEGNNYSSFGGYFGAVLFRMVRDRLDCPRVRHEREFSASSIDVDEVMESILAKYRNVGS